MYVNDKVSSLLLGRLVHFVDLKDCVQNFDSLNLEVTLSKCNVFTLSSQPQNYIEASHFSGEFLARWNY